MSGLTQIGNQGLNTGGPRRFWSLAGVRWLLPIVTVTAAVILGRLLDYYWHSTPFTSLFICAILISAWVGGFGPGLLAVTLSVLAFDYYFLPPIFSFAVEWNAMPRLILFAVSALMVALLAASQRSRTESLSRTRDDLAAKVQELKTVNEALHTENAERKRAEGALQKAQAELAHVSRLTTMGELTASIAHEVNQPLTAVVNNANASISLLPQGAPNLEEVRQALTEIIDDANRASDVIARVRQLAKRAPIEKSLLDLRDVVQDVLALARYESAARNVTIRTDLSKDLPSVFGDRVQLQQVLLNLIINGMDAMNEIEESKRVLTICGRRETRDGTFEALLSVSDSGVGLKPEAMDRIFEAFFTTKPQGMGMGLAISHSIIEAHGGRLWAEPNVGPGATFLFSLPAATERRGGGGSCHRHHIMNGINQHNKFWRAAAQCLFGSISIALLPFVCFSLRFSLASHTRSFGWRVSTGEIFWSEETFRIFQYAAESKP
jgi:signal transduction histidine kinase